MTHNVLTPNRVHGIGTGKTELFKVQYIQDYFRAIVTLCYQRFYQCFDVRFPYLLVIFTTVTQQILHSFVKFKCTLKNKQPMTSETLSPPLFLCIAHMQSSSQILTKIFIQVVHMMDLIMTRHHIDEEVS